MATNYKKTYNPYPSTFTNPIKVDEPTTKSKLLKSDVNKMLEINKSIKTNQLIKIKTKQPTKPNQLIKTEWIIREPIEKIQIAIPYPKLKYHMVRVYELAKLHGQINALKNEALKLIDKNNQLINMLKLIPNDNDKKYIIIKQMFSIYDFKNIKNDIYSIIQPNNKLMNIYLHIKKLILPEKYNLIHYRYESDFTGFFNISNIQSLDYLIDNIHFKNKNLKIYVACSNLKSLAKTEYLLKDFNEYTNIIIKDDYLEKYKLNNLNFEEKAFIDFMIGKNAEEVYGHNKSSFSLLLNFMKNTHNFYNT